MLEREEPVAGQHKASYRQSASGLTKESHCPLLCRVDFIARLTVYLRSQVG